MAITTKWLEEQGLTQEQAAAVFAERGKEIEADKTAKQNLQGQLDTANKKVGEYEATITSLQAKEGDAEAVKGELATLKQQIETDKAERTKEAERAKLVERFKAANGDKKFLNDLTEKGVCDSFLAALADDTHKGKSDTDILTAITQDKGYYASQNPPGNINVPGAVNTTVTKEMYDKMGYAERYKLKTEQPQAYAELTKKE